MNPKFFETQADFREWLEHEHDRADELWMGLHRKDAGPPGITYPEALDAALCFGWIDGLRRTLGEMSYAIRFSPRKPGSPWSLVNIRRVHELSALGLMTAAGLRAFEGRDEQRAARHAETRNTAQLSDEEERSFRANPAAWEFFSRQTPWYRRTAAWWLISAKREETRRQRLLTLIEESGHHRAIPPMAKYVQLKP